MTFNQTTVITRSNLCLFVQKRSVRIIKANRKIKCRFTVCLFFFLFTNK